MGVLQNAADSANFSLSCCSTRRNRAKNTTVIARSEATWQSPGITLDNETVQSMAHFECYFYFHCNYFVKLYQEIATAAKAASQ